MPPKIRKLFSSPKEPGSIVNEDGTVFIPFFENPLTDNEIAARTAGIDKVLASTKELHQLFVDFEQLVQGQQTYINKITQHVEEAHELTRDGLNKIVEASDMQRGGATMFDMFVGGAKGGIPEYNKSTIPAAPVAMVNSASSSRRDTVEQIPQKPTGFFSSLFRLGKTKEKSTTNA